MTVSKILSFPMDSGPFTSATATHFWSYHIHDLLPNTFLLCYNLVLEWWQLQSFSVTCLEPGHDKGLEPGHEPGQEVLKPVLSQKWAMPLALKEIEGIEELMEIRKMFHGGKGVFYFLWSPNERKFRTVLKTSSWTQWNLHGK